MRRTLLLNADYLPLTLVPLSVIPWQNAIKLQFLNGAQVVETYDDWDVHSPSVTMAVPAVMALHEFIPIRFKKAVKFSRRNVYVRDDYMCQYCKSVFGRENLTLDHVVPKAHGGRTTWKNVVTACQPCNHHRGDNVRIQPIKQPHKPGYIELENKALKSVVKADHKTWLLYLPWDEKLIIKKY